MYKYLCYFIKIYIKTLYRFGIELIVNLKQIHKAGYLHVDLKEDNIVSLTQEKVINEDPLHFTLIDYGWSTPYREENKNHHTKDEWKRIKCGNFINANINALKGESISRKDDMISLIYVLLGITENKLETTKITTRIESKLKYEMLECKLKLDLNEICKRNNLLELGEIFNQIKALNFEDKPVYLEYIKILNRRIEKVEL